jgi:hypothetical protein
MWQRQGNQEILIDGLLVKASITVVKRYIRGGLNF